MSISVIPEWMAELDEEDVSFIRNFLLCSGSLKEVAQFVGQRLAPLEGVTATATHFILKKYKEKHLIFEKRQEQEREWIFV